MRARAATVLLFVATTLGLAGACGGEQPAGMNDGTWVAGPTYGACRDGQKRPCGITLRVVDGVADCLHATEVCQNGGWGECGEEGPVTTKSVVVPEKWASEPEDGPGASSKALGAPGPCKDNPCNPYCRTFDDTVPGTLDAGADGLVYGADGGISLPPPVVSDGGTANLDGDKFGERANWGGACTKNADCNLDQYCKKTPPTAATGVCTSWKPGEFNDKCMSTGTTVGAVQPTETCRFVHDGDRYSEFFGALVSGQFDKTYTTTPVIVGIANYSEYLESSTQLTTEDPNGKLKLIDARACKVVASIPSAAGWPADPDGGALAFHLGTTPLLVDLNDDGVPEIIAWDKGGANWYGPYRLFAFSVAVSVGSDKLTTIYSVQPYAGWRDPAGRVGRAWQSTLSGANYAAKLPLRGGDGTGPTAIDLNGDGKPEIVANGWVINRLGQLIGTRPLPGGTSQFDAEAVEWRGDSPIVGDFDLDGSVELLTRAGMWQAGGFAVTGGELTGMTWSIDPLFNRPTNGGAPIPSSTYSYASKAWQAVADFGAFGSVADRPEIVWVSENRVRVMAIDGRPVMGFPATTSPAPPAGLAGEVAVPGGGGGGINIADFDGDGLPEFGIAGASYYTVFDIDCISPRSYKGKSGTCNRAGAACDCLARGDCGTGATCPPGVLWSRAVQDQSSFVTGSTVFDFNADDKAEVVYADECWTRVYDGNTGQVVFSTKHSSGTVTEQPIVADVNLDGRADLVVPNERMLEVRPGEGMFCPTRLDRLDLNTSGWYYPGALRVVRSGTVEVRAEPYSSLDRLVVTLPSGVTRTYWPAAESTPISTRRFTFTVGATDPVGSWSYRIYSSGTSWTRMSVWEQGLALEGSTEPATSSLALAAGGEGTDAQFAGLRCSTSADCPTSTMTCQVGLCRCTTHAQCGTGFKCINPPAGTPGSGMTCRPTRAYGNGSGVSGVQVWSGPGAGWAQSRWIWNQHAYTPALIKDDGRVKTTSACTADEAAAWTPANPRENSFRQQLQYPGTPASGMPDLTVKYPCTVDKLTLCNRGAGAAPPGVMVVGFPGNSSGFEGSSDKNVTIGPCYTTAPLAPGACVDVPCPGAGKGTEEYMVNPSCTGGFCESDADCKGTAKCNLTTGYCQASCTKSSALGATPPLPECSDNSGSWSFVHGSKSAVCGGLTPPSSATFTRDFQGVCPSGTRVRWGLFTWETATPVGTHIAFTFKTADTQAALGAAVAPAVAVVAMPGYSPAGSSTPTADPQVCKTSSSPACYRDLSKLIVPASHPWLRMEATLVPNPVAGTGPTLNYWNVTYDCPPTE